MSHHPVPNPHGGPVHVVPADLESALGLINLIGAATRVLGREITMPDDHADLAAARQLLELLGLVTPAAEPARGDVLTAISRLSPAQAGDVLRRWVREPIGAGS